MMRRRTIAIIAAALAIIMLGFALAGVLEYVETMEFVDVDGETGKYEIYAVVDTDGTEMCEAWEYRGHKGYIRADNRF
jgi:hypothetical protein